MNRHAIKPDALYSLPSLTTFPYRGKVNAGKGDHVKRESGLCAYDKKIYRRLCIDAVNARGVVEL